jgi:hypothetical protein
MKNSLHHSRELNPTSQVEAQRMSVQASAKAPVPEGVWRGDKPADDDKLSLSSSLRIWPQVIIAELLNLLEKRRYDACNSFSFIILKTIQATKTPCLHPKFTLV